MKKRLQMKVKLEFTVDCRVHVTGATVSLFLSPRSFSYFHSQHETEVTAANCMSEMYSRWIPRTRCRKRRGEVEETSEFAWKRRHSLRLLVRRTKHWLSWVTSEVKQTLASASVCKSTCCRVQLKRRERSTYWTTFQLAVTSVPEIPSLFSVSVLVRISVLTSDHN